MIESDPRIKYFNEIIKWVAEEHFDSPDGTVLDYGSAVIGSMILAESVGLTNKDIELAVQIGAAKGNQRHQRLFSMA